MSNPRAEILFVDVDDTLVRVRSAGTKRIPIAPVVDRVKALKEDQAPAEWRLCRHVHPFNVASIETEA